jgi:hypothetical protein
LKRRAVLHRPDLTGVPRSCGLVLPPALVGPVERGPPGDSKAATPCLQTALQI